VSSIFGSIFAGLPRQGPGRPSDTVRALRIAQEWLPSEPRVLDLGCGSGGSTVVLAELLAGPPILAVDRNRDALEALAQAHPERIRALVADLGEIDPDLGPFDLIWSEGAAYTIGLSTALRAWAGLLASGGVLALSELCWLTEDRPPPASRFWSDGYPAMGTVADATAHIEAAGYVLKESFTLPPESWWELYYTPMEARLAELVSTHVNDAGALGVIENVQAEIDLFRSHGASYGYVFFILQARA
jgi:SAM-dependent methyltransferase